MDHRYERILSLHRLLKSAHYPVPLSRLLDELGCSRATLYRDVGFLRDFLGAPVEISDDPSGFRYATGEAERFEPFAFPRKGAAVRQILGRPGEVWLPESGTEHISVIRAASA